MGNATTSELEMDLEEESSIRVTPVIEGMLNRIGYPRMQFKLENGELIVDQNPVVVGAPWVMPGGISSM